jgi:hypothetical protein
MAMAYAGLRAGLTFLNAQTELGPREAAVVALAAEARNGAKAAAGSKADEIETPVDSPGRGSDEEAQRTPLQRREGGGSSTPIIGSGRTAGSALGVIWFDTPGRIQATEPTRIGREWLQWKLIDGESGAKFGGADVFIHDSANPGPVRPLGVSASEGRRARDRNILPIESGRMRCVIFVDEPRSRRQKHAAKRRVTGPMDSAPTAPSSSCFLPRP